MADGTEQEAEARAMSIYRTIDREDAEDYVLEYFRDVAEGQCAIGIANVFRIRVKTLDNTTYFAFKALGHNLFGVKDNSANTWEVHSQRPAYFPSNWRALHEGTWEKIGSIERWGEHLSRRRGR